MYALFRLIREKPTIICLLGIHTSGKTTIGEKLHSLGLPYYLEIGNELIRKLKPKTLEEAMLLDKEIMRREIERDSLIVREGVKTAVIETWHVGNIAYAEIRTPSVANEYKSLLNELFNKCSPLFFFLDISDETFRERANKLVPIGIDENVFTFYQNIKNNILSLLKELNINYYSIDANQKMDGVLKDIKDVLLENGIILQK